MKKGTPQTNFAAYLPNSNFSKIIPSEMK